MNARHRMKLGGRAQLGAGLAVLALSGLHQLTGLGGRTFALWYQPSVFLVCGLLVLARIPRERTAQAAWSLLGAGLIVYGGGSVLFNLMYADAAVVPFPSAADVMWVLMYPVAFASFGLLVRLRFANVAGVLWLDGIICGGVVAALAATVVFDPVLDLTLANGPASVVRLAYPLGDLLCFGFAVAVWGMSGRRADRMWILLGAGFALLAVADGFYVVEAAHGTWQPGDVLDLPYAGATMLIAAAAWVTPRRTVLRREQQTERVLMPVFFACIALVDVGIALFVDLNPLAAVLGFASLVVIVVRFAVTLGWLRGQRAQLARLAAADPLTGLPNHRTLHQRLEQELDRARRAGTPLAVVALDIDHFKAINDSFGHAEGDAILQAIAGTLTRELRSSDLVGRVGGEEFALVLPGSDGETAFAIAERARLAVRDIEVHGTRISCSGGVASYPADDEDGRRLLELADGALYFAKQHGRAQVRRYDPTQMVLLSSAEQHRQVREVLDDPGALTPVFQPIVELATGRVAGYEALTRFLVTEPVRPPDVWFAQARRCGLGNALEAKAIERALAVPGRPEGAYLSLNVSPAGLLSDEVAAVLPRDLGGLVIELTEDELFSTDEALDHALADLRARGARVAVDDAGAGYAGLPQLVRIKPDILKLDRSLIRDIHADGAKAALVEALARFATTTGSAVCAEGIEEPAELRTLARLDVTYAQGFALARPSAEWAGVDRSVVAVATAPARDGMRLADAERTDGARPTFGAVVDALVRVDSPEGLSDVVPLITTYAAADEAALSRVTRDGAGVQTLSVHDWGNPGAVYPLAEYPSTERIVADQLVGQVVRGDPAADAAELALLEESGHGAVLMAPIIHGGATVGLLEIYRRSPRPWTPTEVDQVRMLAYHLGATLATLTALAPAA